MRGKYKYLIFIISVLLIILVGAIGGENSIAINEQSQIVIIGNVSNGNTETFKDVKVIFESSPDKNFKKETITDDKGNYSIKVPKGKYTIKFEYPSIYRYSTNEIKMKESQLIEKNIELAFVFGNSQEYNVNFFDDCKFTADGNSLRIIKNKYNDDSETKTKISNLQRNTDSENAFHNLIYEGYKGVTVILSDKSTDEINSYIDDAMLGSDYNIVIGSTTESIKDIASRIYYKLGMTLPTNAVDIKGTTSTDNSATSKEIEIKTTTVIDVIAKKLSPSGNNTNLSGDFISGKVYVEDELYDGKVDVILRNVANNKIVGTTIVENGKYSIGYPGGGKYKLEFKFIDSNTVSGQYYESDNSKYSPIGVGSTTNNCLKTTNLQDIKNKFKTIDYKQEQKIDDENYDDVGLEGESNQFTVPSKSNIFNPDDSTNKIKANIRLKKRDKFSLTVKQYVNKYKIVLSNGQIFRQYTHGENKQAEEVGLFNITLNTDLSYGAKLFVEYKIEIINNSNIDCKGYKLLSRFENLEYNKDQYLLSNINEKNSKYNWNPITDINQINNILINGTDDTNAMTYLIVEDGNGVGAGKSETYYVTLTRPLDAEDGSTIFNGASELIIYKNDEGRRNYSSIAGGAKENIIRAGNFVSEGKEPDTGISEDIAVLPPTGKK